jgi:hypothetical protein
MTNTPSPGGGAGTPIAGVSKFPDGAGNGRNGFGDVTSYPILTEQVSFPSAPAGFPPATLPGGSPSSLPGGSPLSLTVEAALRDVLGYRPKAGDTKGFLNALNKSFDLRRVEGHTEWKWTPRTYAGQIDTEMGAVTGAQASIYARAKVAQDQSLPLLDGLYALITETPQEDLDSIRAIVRAEIIDLVSEFGVVGGPRVQRVDDLFRLLLNLNPGDPVVTDGENVAGQLGILSKRFGLERDNINTIDDEQNLTNFLILADYINSLKQSWDSYRPFFTRTGSEPFLGTQLVLMARALTAVSEAVQDVYFTMDSVFLGPAERQVLELDYYDVSAGGVITGRTAAVPDVPGDLDAPAGTAPGQIYPYTFSTSAAPLFVSELMDWISRTAAQEAPRLLQDAGKDGVIAIFPTLDLLRKLVHGAMIAAPPYNGAQNPNVQPLPRGFLTDRVQRALQMLADQLDEATQLAGEISQPAAPNRNAIPDAQTYQALTDLLGPNGLQTLVAIVQQVQNQAIAASGGQPMAAQARQPMAAPGRRTP